MSRRSAVLLVLVCVLFAACGSDPLPDYQSQKRAYATVYVPDGGNTPPGAEYARGVLSDDADHSVVRDAFVRDERLLGVVVTSQMTGAALRQLLLILAEDFGRMFRDSDAEVVAYDEASKTAVARAIYRRSDGIVTYASDR